MCVGAGAALGETWDAGGLPEGGPSWLPSSPVRSIVSTTIA